MSRELDIAVARAMGFRVVKDAQNVRGVQVGTSGRKGHDLPRYSKDAALIPVLLTWIKDQRNDDNYIIALSKECGVSLYERNELPLTASWKLLCATPEQHCRAFIASMPAP